jgi:hypothetical protein
MSSQSRSTSVTWWAAVWRGLVIDAEAKHISKLGQAVWLYLYCILHADRKTGILTRRLSTIALDMHVPLRTVRRWLSVLRNNDYVKVQQTAHSLVIHICRWKPWLKVE